MSTKKILVLFLMLGSIFVGCTTSSGVVTPNTYGEITINANTMSLASTELWTAHIYFKRGNHSLLETTSFNGDSLSATIKIPVGTWDISMALLDEQGVAHYQDTITNITIFPDIPRTLEFQLRPADGMVNVSIDLTDYPQTTEVLRVRVHFNNDVKELSRDDATEPLQGSFSLPPGSYNFKVELFTSSFHAGNRIDAGIWKIVDVYPLSELTLIWTPYMEQLSINADIHVIPNPPQNLAVTVNGTQVELVWDPSPTANLMSYNVYWQPNPFSPFELIEVLDAHTLFFNHDLSEYLANNPMYNGVSYCVSAKNTVGINGYRSQIIKVYLN